jgi:hypothetical protein
MKIERGTGNRPLFLLTVSKKNPHGEDFSFLPLKSAWKGIDIYKLWWYNNIYKLYNLYMLYNKRKGV